MGLCTSAQLKTRLGIGSGDTTQDAILTQVIASVSELLCGSKGCGRPLEQAERTKLFDVEPLQYIRHLWLPATPIVEIDTVIEAYDGLWADGEELTEDTDFVVDTATGRLTRVGTHWLPGEPSVQVVYTGGYVAAGATPQTGETALPNDIVEAAILQCVHTMRTRFGPAATGVSAGGSNVSGPGAAILPEVSEILARYRSFSS